VSSLLSPGNTPNTTDSSASVFHGSSPRWLASILQLIMSKSKSKLCYDRQSVGQSVLVSSSFWGPHDQRGQVCHNCCWPLPVQSFSGLSPAGFITYFTVSDLRLPQCGGLGPLFISPGTGFPFCHLLRLTGLWWRYSNLPPHGRTMTDWEIAASPHQHSDPWFGVSWDSWPLTSLLGLSYIASAWTAHKPPLLAVALLQCDMPIASDHV
jgi:hypothetical protein